MTDSRDHDLPLGPELFALLNTKQWVGTAKPAVYGEGGLTERQIEFIEKRLGFPLPPDFHYFLEHIIDPGEVLFNWHHFEIEHYDDLINQVLQGIEFDIEKNDLWLFRWGSRPKKLSAALDIARQDFWTWPKLLPICGHRFLAAEPCRARNPVFSIVQTDIIYYGTNLAQFLIHEFIDKSAYADDQEVQRIPIWSDFVDNREKVLTEGMTRP